MTGGWAGSDRSSRLPADWAKIRQAIGERDGWRCQWFDQGKKCGRPGNEVDHRRPGDDHSPGNLRVLCSWHHGRKSGREGAQALAAKRKQIDKKFRRPAEKHPGLL